MRYFLICAMVSAFLAACSSSNNPPVGREPPADCARPPVAGETDGGLGGTGNAPDPCEDVKVVK